MKFKNLFSWLVIGFGIFVEASPLHAQTNFWKQINGPFGGRIYDLAINANGHIFAGTDHFVFRSVDSGEQWVQITNGLKSFVSALAINAHGHISAGTADGVYRSTDNGDHWTPSFNGAVNTIVRSLVINSDGYILAGTDRGLYRSLAAVSDLFKTTPRKVLINRN